MSPTDCAPARTAPRATLHATARLRRAAVLLTVARTAAPELRAGPELDLFRQACVAPYRATPPHSGDRGLAKSGDEERAHAGARSSEALGGSRHGGNEDFQWDRERSGSDAHAAASARKRYSGCPRISELCSFEEVVLEASLCGGGRAAALEPPQREVCVRSVRSCECVVPYMYALGSYAQV